jgi:hypothetical protein
MTVCGGSLMVEHDSIQNQGGGSIPTPSLHDKMFTKPIVPFFAEMFREEYIRDIGIIKSPRQFMVKIISHSAANDFVKEHHYLRRKLYIARNISYGIFAGSWLVGVLMFGFPVWRVYHGLVPPYAPASCPELLRLCTVGGLPKNTESYFIGVCLRKLRGDWQRETGTPPACVTSFCDNAFGFNGSIYRATNFVPFKKTRGRPTNPGKPHGKWGRNTFEQSAEKTMYVYWYKK